ncbi:MAG TPA: periplasmic heavy metal sensor [Candidatus Binatia bacterium]|nr:periplasmic heavy metal sensor [Candidatus Binatia bacterium]
MSRFPWRTLLFLSVALNLLVIGAVAGAWGAGVRLQREVGDAVVARMPGPRAFLQALPAETREIMRGELADSWTESRELRRAALQARRDAFAAAAAEPYDAERVRAAFARLRAADQRAIGVFHDNVIEAFARLTPEQRREAMEALARAAPARRQNIAPGEDAGEGAAPAQEDASASERQKMRDLVRERRRERRERRQQQEQQTP